MPHSFKTKIAHVFENGDKIEMEAHLDAEDHQQAFEQARQRFSAAVSELATVESITIDKSKIELGH